MTYYLILFAVVVWFASLLPLIRLTLKYKRQRDVLYQSICDEDQKYDDYTEEYCAVCDEIEAEGAR